MMRFLGFLTLLIAIAANAAPARAQAPPQPVAQIPFEVGYDGLIIIPVMVNGEGPYDFVVDTGATVTVFFDNLARNQPLSPIFGDERRIVGLSSAAWLPAKSAPALEIGALRFANHPVVVIDDWAPDRPTPQGVIGLDILEDYLVVFDTARAMMRLYPADAANNALGGWSAAPMRPVMFGALSRPLYIVDATIKGARIPMLIDLGAADPVINYAALAKIMKNQYDPRRQFSGRATRFGPRFADLFDNREEAKLVRMSRLSIGDVIWRDPTLVVFDALVFEELDAIGSPYGLIGAKLLLTRSFALDFHNAQFLMGPETEMLRPGL